jgi:para-nitrobenzyl esterase
MSIVETRHGKVEGLTREGHQAYLGIPFAAAPNGPHRFGAPRPPAAWGGVREAKAFGASAVQPKTHTVPGFAASGARDEDCLFLNVYTPRADDRKRPVMVWIHGGAFSYGSGSEALYDGAQLCTRGDVVVVTIHYRLGVLGYAYLSQHGGERVDAPDNRGQLDQIAALRWVRDNIARFGGDPDAVTVFGESAGGAATAALLVMPEAKGLMRRAVCQSGTANMLPSVEAAAAMTDAWLKQLGLSRADDPRLFELPAQALIDAQQAVPGMFAPVHGVPSLPARPIEALANGVARDVELLLGTNRDEIKLFMPARRAPIDDAALRQGVQAAVGRKLAARTDALIATYRASRAAHGLPADNIAILDAISSDASFRVPAVRTADAHSALQPGTYLYLFTHECPARSGALGACHALEIPFVFGLATSAANARFVGEGPAVAALQDAIMDAWLAFARGGAPGRAGEVEWPRYDAREQSTMVLGRQCMVERPPLAEELAAWA